ncbi:MAG: thioredoxin family protein [Spirochaetes bacterium]|nr:thioredoxin family protein [Spirochaetota bacterium]
MTRMTLPALLLSLALPAFGAPNPGAHGVDEGSKNVKASFLSEYEAVKPGMTTRVGVRLKIKKNWHIYWLNPGESGLPTRVVLTLPEGWRQGPLHYPAPLYANDEGIANFFYENEAVIWTEVTIPPEAPTGKIGRIGVKIDWLECDKECVPGDAEIRGAVAVGKREKTNEAATKALDGALHAVPVSSPFWKVRATRKGDGVALSLRSVDPRLPEGSLVRFFPLDGEVFAPSNRVLIGGPGRIDIFQPIASRSMGAEPTVLRGVVTSSKGWGLAETRIALSIETEIEGGGKAGATPIWLVILWALAGGVILNLMPCVFPVLSIKILGFVRQSGGDQRLIRRQGVVYFLGVILSFLAIAGLLIGLKAGGQALGWGFQLQSPLFILGMTSLVFILALNLLGVFEIGTRLASVGGELPYRGGMAGSFWSGVLAVVIASPCTAPFMGAALGYALAQPWYASLVVFLFLGIGMGAPYLILSWKSGWLAHLPKPGEWMGIFKQAMAFPMFATALWLAWVFGTQTGVDGMLRLLGALLLLALGAWIFGHWAQPHRGRRSIWLARILALALAALALYGGYTATRFKPAATARGAQAGELTWEAWSPERVKALEAAGKPYFVDFTAAWCLTCQVNKKTSLHTRAVEKAFRERGVTLLSADWTDHNPAIARALSSMGRAGVPVYLWNDGSGASATRILPELLTEGIVLEAIGAGKASGSRKVP